MRLPPFIQNRIPTRRELLAAFFICLFPVQLWSWFVFLHKLPSYLLSMSLGQTLSIFAYLQVFALLESGLLWLVVALLAAVLPWRLFRERFIPQALLLVLALAGWAAGVQVMLLGVETETSSGGGYLPYAWTLLWLVFLVGMSILAVKLPRVTKTLLEVVERLSLLSGLYLAIDLLALAAVILRYVAAALS